MSDVTSRHSEDSLRYNIDETKTLLALWERLSDESDMIGWLCTIHRHAVSYPNNPEARNKVQGQLNKASSFIALTYIWALLEVSGGDICALGGVFGRGIWALVGVSGGEVCALVGVFGWNIWALVGVCGGDIRALVGIPGRDK